MSDSLQRGNFNNVPNGQSKFQFIPNHGFEAQNSKDNESNPLDPQKMLAVILRYKWLILLFLIAGTTGAWFYADSITPTYESTGKLMISPTDAFAKNDELSKIITKTTGFGTNSTLENELQVIKSRKFSRQVAQKMLQDSLGDINTFPILWTKEEETGDIYTTSEDVVAARIRRNLNIQKPEDDEESDVVEVSFQSASPREAALVVNEAMDIYVDNSTQQNRLAAEKTAEFLKDEREKVEEKLHRSEERLRRYMDSTGIVQIEEQTTDIVSRRAETEAEIQRIKLELETVDEAISINEEQLERVKPGLAEQFSEAIGPRIRNSQEELAKYERERMLIISKNPGVLDREPVPSRLKSVNEQIDQLKSEIKELSNKLFTDNDVFMGMDSEVRAEMVSGIQSRLVELRIEQNQYRSRLEALAQYKQEMDSNFNSLPEGIIELEKLKRDVRINEDLYLNVSRQYADISVWKQTQFGFGRIIDRGEIPNSPVSPNKMIILLWGLMLGGFLAAIIITIRESRDNSIKEVQQLRTMYLPTLTLSIVPSFEKVPKKKRKSFSVGEGIIPDEMVLLQDRSSLVSEAIRRLKNNIVYQHGDAPPQTIAVTSAEKGDGKSTIVANLGVAFAEDGYNTLIIGADFRRPKLQQYFGLPNKTGLSDYLKGKIPVVQLIQETDVRNLKVITAGTDTERPDIIGNSMTFKQFLQKMREKFDVIILDTPPFGIISDSTSLLKNAETTIVVAKYRKTNKGMLLRTVDELGHIQANVSSIVLNDFDHRKEVGNYYGAGYYQAMYSNYKAYLK